MNFIQTSCDREKIESCSPPSMNQVTLRQDFTDRLEVVGSRSFCGQEDSEKTALYDAIWQFCDQKCVQPGRALW